MRTATAARSYSARIRKPNTGTSRRRSMLSALGMVHTRSVTIGSRLTPPSSPLITPRRGAFAVPLASLRGVGVGGGTHAVRYEVELRDRDAARVGRGRHERRVGAAQRDRGDEVRRDP